MLRLLSHVPLMLLFAISFAAGSCASASSELPTPTLAKSLDAQRSFEPIRRAWLVSSPDKRVELAPRIQTFRARFAFDPLARAADTYLALIALKQNQIGVATSLITSIRTGPKGNTRDVSTIVQGAVLARQNRPSAALFLLTPLVGKTLDDYARDVLHETVVSAAIQLQKWHQAVVYMNEWIHSVSKQDLPALQHIIAELLNIFPPDVFETIWTNVADPAGSDIWHHELKRLVALHVAEIAVRRHDPLLAKSVLQSSRAVLSQSPAGVALARLATSANLTPKVVNARVGLLVDTRSSEMVHRSSQVAAGALHLFDPSHGNSSTGKGSAVLLTENFKTTEQLRSAVQQLMLQGASVIIGGYDPVTARMLSTVAQSEIIPVITLVYPEKLPKNSHFTFVLGAAEPSWQTPVSSLALQQVSAGTDVRIAAGMPSQYPRDFGCPHNTVPQAASFFPVATWKKQQIQAIAIDAPDSCARLLLAELESVLSLQYSPKIFLGLQARNALSKEPNDVKTGKKNNKLRNVRVATSGYMDESADNQPASLRHWISLKGAAPSWFEALGRDAAMIAMHGISDLPNRITVDPEQVRTVRAFVQQSIASCSVELWTSKQHGFQNSQTIGRDIVFVDK